MKNSIAKRISFAAVFAALCLVSTYIINLPLPASGYFNVGDAFVLLSGWCLGPLYGFVAAGVGSALADLLAGYAIYAPATFFIKGVMAFAVAPIYAAIKKLIRKERLDVLARIVSAIACETFMVLGYFLFESVLYGFSGGVPNIVGNILQGVCCVCCAVPVVSVLYHVKATRTFFPALVNKKTEKP